MDDCYIDKTCAIDQLRERQGATLHLVLLMNVAMFVVEFVFGLLAGSVALLADSLDMLGDALVYGFSLYVVAQGSVWKARAAVAKAAVMGLFGVFVFGQPDRERLGIAGGVGGVGDAVTFSSIRTVTRASCGGHQARPPVYASVP